jgi:hypothetical protein
MVMWPPAPVMDLARLAVDSGGDPGAIHRALDPTMLPVSVQLSHFVSYFHLHLWEILHWLLNEKFEGGCYLIS